jgi:hypothetical protein
MSAPPLNKALSAFVEQDPKAGAALLRLIRQHCMDQDAPHPVEDFNFGQQFRAIEQSTDAATALAIGEAIMVDCMRIINDPAVPFADVHAAMVVERLLNTLYLRGIQLGEQAAGMPTFEAYSVFRRTVFL